MNYSKYYCIPGGRHQQKAINVDNCFISFIIILICRMNTELRIKNKEQINKTFSIVKFSENCFSVGVLNVNRKFTLLYSTLPQCYNTFSQNNININIL